MTIDDYKKVKQYIRKKSVGHTRKSLKSLAKKIYIFYNRVRRNIFTGKSKIIQNKFLVADFLQFQVVLIIGVRGACRSNELTNKMIDRLIEIRT